MESLFDIEVYPAKAMSSMMIFACKESKMNQNVPVSSKIMDSTISRAQCTGQTYC